MILNYCFGKNFKTSWNTFKKGKGIYVTLLSQNPKFIFRRVSAFYFYTKKMKQTVAVSKRIFCSFFVIPALVDGLFRLFDKGNWSFV